MKQLATAIGTGLGVGFLPKAPGTWGSLLTVILYYFFFPEPSSVLIQAVFLTIIASVFILGVWSGYQLEPVYGHDPSCVVIDEIAGMAIALFLLPKTVVVILSAFILFRIFDITKWLGANAAQDLPGGWGIMTDDVVAGIWTNLILQIVIYWI